MQPYPGNDPSQQYQQGYQQYPQEYQQYPEYQQYEQYPQQPGYPQQPPYDQQQPYAPTSVPPTSVPPSYVPPYQTGYTTPAVGYQPTGQQPSNTQGLLAMIFGIISIPTFACCYGVLGIGFGIAAIVLGTIGLRKVSEGRATNRGMALAGLICGVIGALFAIIWVVLVTADIVTNGFGYGT